MKRKECIKCGKDHRSNHADTCDGCTERGGEGYCFSCNSHRPYILKKKKICQNCNTKQYYKDNRQKVLERTSKYGREKTRKKRGLPLDHPPLIAKPGEGHLSKTGYRYITRKGHPNSWDSKGIRKDGKPHKYEGRILEHTFIMSEHLGRPLKKGESVHHINGIRDDNRMENLEIWYRGQPAGQRLGEKIEWAKEFLEGYGYDVTRG